jgi:hypothetical protein
MVAFSVFYDIEGLKKDLGVAIKIVFYIDGVSKRWFQASDFPFCCEWSAWSVCYKLVADKGRVLVPIHIAGQNNKA